MSKRNLTENYKKEVTRKAIVLKKRHPYLTWVSIAERFNGVGSSRHLRNIIEKYQPSYFPKRKIKGDIK